MKQEILNLLNTVNRDGIDYLIEFLNKSDFFTAPASRKYHGNYNGGLAKHSYHVYQLLKEKSEKFNLGLNDESIIITGLLHDICKVNTYKIVNKWRKDSNGKWESYKAYETRDNYPLGHGEKSIILILQYMDLTDEEIFLIRWHMGGFENIDNYKYMNNAFNLYKTCVAIHTADMEATYFLDKTITN